jgi:hypothetical protein
MNFEFAGNWGASSQEVLGEGAQRRLRDSSLANYVIRCTAAAPTPVGPTRQREGIHPAKRPCCQRRDRPVNRVQIQFIRATWSSRLRVGLTRMLCPANDFGPVALWQGKRVLQYELDAFGLVP